MSKYFTIAEANEIVRQVEPLVGELIERQAKMATHYQPLRPLLDQGQLNVGNAASSELAQELWMIDQQLEQLKQYGCEVKDIKVGLLDFLTEINGREVYLCWRYGEPEITHYHDLNSGFSGRKPLFTP